jgi:hypothetical protein
MSLTRYENRDIIVQLNQPQYGQLFLQEDLDILPHKYLVPNDPNFVNNNITQVHIYSFYGDYIAGNHSATYMKHDVGTNSLLVDLAETFRAANIRRGSYIVVVNLINEIWGNPDRNPVYIREISPRRDEVKLSVPSNMMIELRQFMETVNTLQNEDILNNLVIDFGFNRVSKISLIKFDKNDPSIIYLKLYKPLDDDLTEKVTGWFGFEAMNPYIDTVILSTPLEQGATTQLRCANYDIDTSEWTSNATILKNWNELLDSDSVTSQRIIDMSLSGSATARLNIDYTDFNNFIFYSSAEERVKNFKYKIGLIEGYQSNIDILTNSTASNTQFISSSVSTYQKRIDVVTTNFDSFERWMYYDDTGSLFTHDISGSITPYPKYLDGGKYVLHHNTSSIATQWYNGLIASASVYDQLNTNRLWWSIPEHILMDDGNSDYVLFVEMIGQHFDNLYSYTRALTQIHERDEHPERGASNDLLYHIAESFGWKLQNTRQLSDLWFYKAGVNAQGEYESTGSMFSLSHENQTQQIWRRIVNNLPYLLKTKGTSRSVKALMSIYGIPQTLISIKEYGGPAKSGNRPQLIEDRFTYALNFGGYQVASLYRQADITQYSSSGHYVPEEFTFRFSTTYSGSQAMTLCNMSDETLPHIFFDLHLHHALDLTGTSSYSGSRQYGKIEMTVCDRGTGNFYSDFTEFLPLYDGDMWTVSVNCNKVSPDVTGSVNFNLKVARADDCSNGTYILSGSASITAPSGTFGYWTADSGSSYVDFGGYGGKFGFSQPTLSGSASGFSGSIHGIKEYYTSLGTETFNEHVLNPAAYHTNNPTSSYDYLYRYFPLGIDAIRYDHFETGSIPSSHPNQDKQFNTSITIIPTDGGQSDQYRHFREQYFVYTPSIGASNVRNNKIRIENSSLTKDLSPSSRSERSEFDLASNDTNRLAIVYSLADQVNRDIYNHMGFDELDQWIADPDLECANEYSELKRFSNEYFKKYEQKNDINAFIRILSVYDYSFFEQIRQLVPGRADLIAGILIEPNILERSKVCISKRPTVENPQWDKTIKVVEKDPSGEYPTYESSASISPDFDMYRETYVTASITSTEDFDFEYCYLTGSIPDPAEFEMDSIHHQDIIHQKTGLCGVVDVYPNRYSGSGAVTQSYIDNPRISNCRYKKKVCYYSEWTGFTNVVTDGRFLDSGASVWTFGGDGVTSGSFSDYTSSVVYHLDSAPYKKFLILSGSSFVSQSLETDVGKEYYIIIRAAVTYDEMNDTPLTVSMSNSHYDIKKASISTYTANGDVEYIIGADLLTSSGSAYYVRSCEIAFTGSGVDELVIHSNSVVNNAHLYSVEIFPKFTTYERQWLRLQNREIKRSAYCIEESGSYQIDECGTRNRSRFIGSKMSSADFNVDSSDTSDGGPVVVIKESNPNSLFIKEDGEDGNLLVE